MTEDRDRRTLIAVFVAVLASVAVVIAWWWWREAGTPELLSVAVVYRADGETVASDRPRLLSAGARVSAAAVVGFSRRGGEARRLCALSPVEIAGEAVAVEPLDAWPDGYGALRATWLTIEPALFGWQEVALATADTLRYHEFLAQELGQALVAHPTLEAHNDDFLSAPVAGNTVAAGPLRLKVRVGQYRRGEDLLARQAVSSPGAADVPAGSVATVVVGLTPPPGIDPAIARVLRLGCFTFAPGVWPDGGAGWPLPRAPRELVRQWLIATPEAVAAVAAAGNPLAAPWRVPLTIELTGSELRGAALREKLRWGSDVRPGDAVTGGARWAALVADDGDGVLSLGDRALFAWLGPARFATLAEARGGPGAGEPLALRRRWQLPVAGS